MSTATPTALLQPRLPRAGERHYSIAEVVLALRREKALSDEWQWRGLDILVGEMYLEVRLSASCHHGTAPRAWVHIPTERWRRPDEPAGLVLTDTTVEPAVEGDAPRYQRILTSCLRKALDGQL